MTTSERRPTLLTSDEVAAVLRRAAELDAGIDEASGDTGGRIDLAVIEQAAGEVGLSPAAVRQAYAELQTGAIEPAGKAPAKHPGRVLGPAIVVEQRVVHLPIEQVRDRVGAFLRRQTFELRRSTPESSLWRRREDVAASFKRAFDFSKNIKLEDPRAVTVHLTAVVDQEGRPATLVRLEADLGQIKTGGAIAAVSCAGVAGAFAGITFAVAGSPPVAPELLLGWAATWAAFTPAGLGIARYRLTRKRDKVAELLASFLDGLGP
jgi:hypothetical protein